MTNQQFFKWNIVTNVCMALSINTMATILAGGDTFAGWVVGCCCAFTINTVAAVLLPMARLGSWFSGKICKSSPGRWQEVLSRNFIINAVYVTIVSFGMALIHVGVCAQTIPVWLSTYVQLHITGLATALLIEKPVLRLTSN